MYVICYDMMSVKSTMSRHNGTKSEINCDDNKSRRLHVLLKYSADFTHHNVVPKPITFHQIHADVIMAAAGDDRCRDDTGTAPPHCITKGC